MKHTLTLSNLDSPQSYQTGIVWFRQDLRLADNPALNAACRSCQKIVLVFIDDPKAQTVSQVGAASRVWLHHSLEALTADLQGKSLELILLQGGALDVLERLTTEVSADAVFWNRCYDPVSIKRDAKIKKVLSRTLSVNSFNGLLLCEPWNLSKPDGDPYRVFTPFWRKLLTLLPEEKPLAVPRKWPLQGQTNNLSNRFALTDLDYLPGLSWGHSMMEHWRVGEKAAHSRLKKFLQGSVTEYDHGRNVPGIDGTSRLSPHLHMGEISPRQVLHAIRALGSNALQKDADTEKFAREIGWREFAYHLLYHFPKTVTEPMDLRFDNFAWERLHRETLERWQQGRTGVPIIDAGMRQLWQTGWMHNRVRMVVASYLVKNLLYSWQHGEAWFRDTLVDADIASNVMGWQWVAGSGADAAPYFRVFNPVLQGEKFDPEGHYVRSFVPEVSSLPNKFIHKPWELEASERPADYPLPLVDLKESRQRALMRFDQIKRPGVTPNK